MPFGRAPQRRSLRDPRRLRIRRRCADLRARDVDRGERERVPVIEDPAWAARLLSSGGLVAIPTETVYGLAADITHREAVARIFSAKGRPTGHPLILHVADVESARRFGVLG